MIRIVIEWPEIVTIGMCLAILGYVRWRLRK
jgi:hypothetical protein